MISCGVDIVELDTMRISYMRQGQRLLERLLTANERQAFYELNHADRQVAFLAKRFAAKEALLKAVKTGLAGGFNWQQIEVFKEKSGSVSFKLSADFFATLLALNILPNYSAESKLEIALSLSDSAHYAIAQVFIVW